MDALLKQLGEALSEQPGIHVPARGDQAAVSDDIWNQYTRTKRQILRLLQAGAHFLAHAVGIREIAPPDQPGVEQITGAIKRPGYGGDFVAVKDAASGLGSMVRASTSTPWHMAPMSLPRCQNCSTLLCNTGSSRYWRIRGYHRRVAE